MAFRLTIETNNAAFDSDKNNEIIRILMKTVKNLAVDTVDTASEIIYDINGNTVGSWHLD